MKYNRLFYKTDQVYHAWCAMKARCTNPNYKNYHLWGGRGISFDPRWEKFEHFEKDMRSSYKNGLSLDRVDVNKNYSKENCRWATSKQQNNNRRDNRLFSYKNLSMTLTAWAKYVGIKRSTLAQRFYVYNWSIEKCLTKEVQIG